MLKHYFRRKNPVLYGEDRQTKNISAGNAAEKRPDGQPEYELLTTVTDNVAQSVIESVLRAEDISYVVRESGNESWRRAILGVNQFGTEIYVPADLLETAKALIEGDGEPAGDLAETGKIPDVVADAGGWAAYNAAHGLDPDNRELPGDLAELGLIPDGDDAFNKNEENLKDGGKNA